MLIHNPIQDYEDSLVRIKNTQNFSFFLNFGTKIVTKNLQIPVGPSTIMGIK